MVWTGIFRYVYRACEEARVVRVLEVICKDKVLYDVWYNVGVPWLPYFEF